MIDWDHIRGILESDRAERVIKFPPAIAPQTCRYCGKHWRTFAGTKLDGHVKCIASPEVIDLVVESIRADPLLPLYKVADLLGLPVNWITAWWNKSTRP